MGDYKLNETVIGIAAPGLEADIDRNLEELGRRKPPLRDIGADGEDLLLTERRRHIDGVELVDLGQCGLLAAAADRVAGIDEMLAHQPVEGRPHLGVVEI